VSITAYKRPAPTRPLLKGGPLNSIPVGDAHYSGTYAMEELALYARKLNRDHNGEYYWQWEYQGNE
jgi:hypothetical protein